jgi:hypothetical protein
LNYFRKQGELRLLTKAAQTLGIVGGIVIEQAAVDAGLTKKKGDQQFMSALPYLVYIIYCKKQYNKKAKCDIVGKEN